VALGACGTRPPCSRPRRTRIQVELYRAPARTRARWRMQVERERTTPARKGLRTTLLVGNLPPLPPPTLTTLLHSAFSQFEEVLECDVLTDEAKTSRGFAFVRLRDARKTELAKAGLDGTHLRPPHERSVDERPMCVRWSLDRATLFVGDLDPGVKAETLQAAFSQFGNVLSCRIDRQPEELGHGSKGCAFVEFSQRSVAAKVCAAAPLPPLPASLGLHSSRVR
jgi:RNA recognition motif-containing protein